MQILLVEDNTDHAELVIRSFKECEIPNEIIHTKDGEAALHFLNHRLSDKTNGSFPLPNLILLDLRLPKIDGVNILASIKNDTNFKQIPVVVLTTSESPYDIEKSYSNHANSYLVKPSDYPNYKKMINDLAHYWLVLNKNNNHT
jgi:CheY-like chemotaxis protein